MRVRWQGDKDGANKLRKAAALRNDAAKLLKDAAAAAKANKKAEADAVSSVCGDRSRWRA